MLAKTMLALKSAMDAQGWTWAASIRPGISRGALDDDDTANPGSNPLPSIIANATNADQIDPTVATFTVSVAVEVRHQADDEQPVTHLTEAGEVGDWLRGETFITDLNQYSGFTAFGITGVSESFNRVGRKWSTEFTFTLTAAPSDIS